MGRKDDDMDDEFEEDLEEDEFEESKFNCRVCGDETYLGEGDDMLQLCDKCLANYDEDKIWEDFDDGKISEDDIATVDLTKYLLKKGKKK